VINKIGLIIEDAIKIATLIQLIGEKRKENYFSEAIVILIILDKDLNVVSTLFLCKRYS